MEIRLAVNLGAQEVKSPRLANASFVWDLGKARLPPLKVSRLLQFVTKLHFKVSHPLLTLLPRLRFQQFLGA